MSSTRRTRTASTMVGTRRPSAAAPSTVHARNPNTHRKGDAGTSNRCPAPYDGDPDPQCRKGQRSLGQHDRVGAALVQDVGPPRHLCTDGRGRTRPGRRRGATGGSRPTARARACAAGPPPNRAGLGRVGLAANERADRGWSRLTDGHVGAAVWGNRAAVPPRAPFAGRAPSLWTDFVVVGRGRRGLDRVLEAARGRAG